MVYKVARMPGEKAKDYVRRSLIVRGKYDPLLFAEAAWPWGVKGGPLADDDIRVWQSVVFDDIAQCLQNPVTRYMPIKVAVASGHGVGKSATIGMLTTWALTCFEDPRILITANTEGQLRTKTSPELGQWVRTSLFGSDFDVDTLSVKLKARPDQHRADLTPWSETNTEAFQGLHAKGRLVMVIMDEASGIPQKIWEVILGALTDANTVLIWIAFGNPTQAVGPFRDCFTKYRNEWITYHIDNRTVEGVNVAAMQAIADRYGEDHDITKVRVRGLFPSTSSRQMVPEHLIDAAMGRHYRKDQYDFAPVILTCDPAWTGDDELVIAMRQGLVSRILETMPKNENDIDVGRRLANWEVRLNADAVFIDQGWGTGIWSYGVEIGRDWKLVSFSSKAGGPGYVNKRAEMYGELVEWLENGGALPVDQKLRDDLMAQEAKPTPDGSILLKSKEDLKKDGLASPDRADAIALTFAEPVYKRPIPISKVVAQRQAGFTSGHGVKSQEYDPFS